MFRLLALALLALSGGALIGQTLPKVGDCRCCDLERVVAPYLRELPAPPLREGIGNSHIAITTVSADAQKYFDQGLNLLHSFWEYEAYRSFSEAARLDPTCAMAYWGICWSLPGKKTEANAERALALKKAKDLAAGTSRREQLYIEAAAALVEKGPTVASPILAKIVELDPDDHDARAFAAYFYRDGYFPGTTVAQGGQTKALRFLREGLARSPDHLALNHYLIHALEIGPEFRKAKDAADRIRKKKPGTGHLLHMPGHIDFLLGDYLLAYQAFLDSREFDLGYMKAESIPSYELPNYLHNLHYLAVTCSEMGRTKEARQYAKEFAAVLIDRKRNLNEGVQLQSFQGRTLEAKVLFRARKWNEALAVLEEEAALEASREDPSTSYLKGLMAYARGQIAIEAGEEAATASQEIRDAASQLGERTQPLQGTVASRYAREAQKVLQLLFMELQAWTDATREEGSISSDWLHQSLKVEETERYRDPPLLSYPLSESFGRLYLHKKRPVPAIEFFEMALKERPGSPWILEGLAQAQQEAGRVADQEKTLALLRERQAKFRP